MKKNNSTVNLNVFMISLACAFLLMILGILGCKHGDTDSSIKVPESLIRELKINERVAGINKSALALYQLTIEQAEGNREIRNEMIAPPSIISVMGMVYAGSDGETKSNFESSLGFNEDTTATLSVLNDLLNQMGSETSFQLRFANRIWSDKAINLNKTFLDFLGLNFSGAHNILDLKNESEKSRNQINQWVMNQTNQKIKDLLPSGSIDQTSDVVLSNAMWVKASWLTTFDPIDNESKKNVFKTENGENIEIPYMNHSTSSAVGFAKLELGYSVVELKTKPDHKDRDLSMLILLPDENTKLRTLESKFNQLEYTKILSSIKEINAIVAMPKFKIKSNNYDIRTVLKKMGLTSPFSSGVNFSKLYAEGNGSSLSYLNHKTFIDVNESGFEVSGAAAGGIARGFSDKIVIDRAFMFIIKDNVTNAILFIGRVADPRMPYKV